MSGRFLPGRCASHLLAQEVVMRRLSLSAIAGPSLLTSWRGKMFLHRYYDYDERKFPRGYYFNLLGIVRVLKFNVATVTQKPDYIFIIEVLGREFVIR